MAHKCVGCALIDLDDEETRCSYCSVDDRPTVGGEAQYVADNLRRYVDGEDNAYEWFLNTYPLMAGEGDLAYVSRCAALEYRAKQTT